MKRLFFFAAISLIITAFVSCDKSPFPGYKTTDTGLYYKQIVKGNGEQVKLGDVVKVDLAYYTHDSLLFTTNNLPTPAYDLVHESLFKGDLYEGFTLMHVGDSMSFMINADSVFQKQFNSPVPEFVKPGSYLRWEVKVSEAMSEEAFQQKQLDEMAALQQKSHDEFVAWINANGVTAEPTESGLIYVCTKKGNGVKPKANQIVKVHYTGKLLDGTVFDSSVERGTPIEFPLGVGRVIPGWDEGIALMSKGEKGVLYIPSELAYGANQVGPMIPAYSNLIFEVELVDFE